jgi:hypothetical protein
MCKGPERKDGNMLMKYGSERNHHGKRSRVKEEKNGKERV